jgi:hypothetical protein
LSKDHADKPIVSFRDRRKKPHPLRKRLFFPLYLLWLGRKIRHGFERRNDVSGYFFSEEEGDELCFSEGASLSFFVFSFGSDFDVRLPFEE